MTEQFFWISKYGDAIYIGYGMEKIEELKTIPTESVLLNFVKLNNTSLGWIVFPS